MGFNCPRWTLANLIPVLFVNWIISTIWILYVTLHLLYLLQIWRPGHPGESHEHDAEMKERGLKQLAISQWLTFMFVFCFIRALFTDPGGVPEDPIWMPDNNEQPSGSSETVGTKTSVETKNSGARRYCKWCNCYKPDRCHHCRVCRSCILRMDHHCPWIANCVGFHNHKFFLLLVFYALVTCSYIAYTMAETLNRVLVEETTFVRRFLVVFGMTISMMMTILLCLFFMLHVWLMMKATTTIEFCEKQYKKTGPAQSGKSIYNNGYFANMQAVLGNNPLFWLVPCAAHHGDPDAGLKFKVNLAIAKGVVEAPPAAPPNQEPNAPSGSEAVEGEHHPEVTGKQASVS